MTIKEAALYYHEHGFRVVPVDEKKRPLVKWKEYQHAQTRDQVERDFTNTTYGVAILTGVDGIEAIDIDCKYDTSGRLLEDFIYLSEKLNPALPVVSLVCQKTKNEGFHVIYKTDQPEGNLKLASRHPEAWEDPHTNPVLIETRGVGGYIVVAPSPGYQFEIGDLTKIKTITQGQRNTLLSAARSFNQIIDRKEPRVKKEIIGSGTTPWEDYNDRHDCIEILEKYGWREVFTHGERVFMKRPGNTEATTSGNYHEGLKLFVSHTTSTPLPSGEGLTPFAIYTHYEHAGDYSAAASEIYKQGYGERKEKKPEQIQPKPIEDRRQIDDLLKSVWANRYNYHDEIKEEDAILTRNDWNRTYKIGGYGQLGIITGEQKSGKTFVLKHLTASALAAGKPMLTFSLNIQKSKNILFIDTEQSQYFFRRSQREIQDMARVVNPSNYYAFHLRRYSKRERMTVLKEVCNQIGNLGLIIIDGVVDLCEDFMDNKHSAASVQEIMTIADVTGALTLGVLHLTKKDGYLRGHLGTEYQNKCDFAIETTQDKEAGFYTVKCRESRFMPFPAFNFTRDEEGRAVLPPSESSGFF